MEIWIIGGIIVALMVYASTKIKNSAARAYQPETIETEEFTILKPEGFISPVTSEFAFEAYTKDYGREDGASENFRQAWAYLTVKDGAGREKEGLTESEIIEKDVVFKIFRKLVKKNNKTYELKISVLQDSLEQYEDRVNEMLDSFS